MIRSTSSPSQRGIRTCIHVILCIQCFIFPQRLIDQILLNDHVKKFYNKSEAYKPYYMYAKNRKFINLTLKNMY